MKARQRFMAVDVPQNLYLRHDACGNVCRYTDDQAGQGAAAGYDHQVGRFTSGLSRQGWSNSPCCSCLRPPPSDFQHRCCSIAACCTMASCQADPQPLCSPCCMSWQGGAAMRADNGSGYAYDAQGYQGYAAPGAGVGGVQGATPYGTYGATGASDSYTYDDGTQVGRAEPGAGSLLQGWGNAGK